MSGPA
ncbi:hypothetical protein SAMN04487972_10347 [Paracoccus halophilus]